MEGRYIPLLWRHNWRDGVSNHQPNDCLLNRLFRHRSKKTSKLRVTGLCEGNPPVTGGFPSQRASNAENFFHLMTLSWYTNNLVCLHQTIFTSSHETAKIGIYGVCCCSELVKLIEAEWQIYVSVTQAIIGFDDLLSPVRPKVLSVPITDYYLLVLWEHNSVKFESKYDDFHWRKCILKKSSVKWRPFCCGNIVVIHMSGRDRWLH